MIAAFNERVEKDVFIGNAQIEFIRQFDPAAAGRFARHRAGFYARREEQERQERLARQAEEEAEEARRQAELDSCTALYLGWADGMAPLRFGRIDATLGSLCRDDGKVMTRREFVISRVRDGWTPRMDEDMTTWYGSRWERKESKPKTVYKLAKDNPCYTVSKTEHDFALYLTGHMEVLDAGTNAGIHRETIPENHKRTDAVGLYEALGDELPATGEACAETES